MSPNLSMPQFIGHTGRVNRSELWPALPLDAWREAYRTLHPESVAAFYRGIMEGLGSLGIAVEIQRRPQEIANAVPFDEDEPPGAYDPDATRRLWQILVSSGKVFDRFRSKFVGKCSPT